MLAGGSSPLTRDVLSQPVRQLIRDRINSVEQLEILLLLRSQPAREWSARDVSDEIRTSEVSAARRLADLVAVRLVTKCGSAPDRFCFSPETPELARALDDLDLDYSERRYTVVELIFSKPIDHLRVYADAFRFRKEDSDG